MDSFGTDYVIHNLPLLILSGLDSRNRSHSDVTSLKQQLLHEGGFRIKTDLPTLESPIADSLRTAFLNHDGSDTLWRAQSPSATPLKLFKIKTVGRVGQTPSKPNPPVSSLHQLGLHSPTSKGASSTSFPQTICR